MLLPWPQAMEKPSMLNAASRVWLDATLDGDSADAEASALGAILLSEVEARRHGDCALMRMECSCIDA
jgi:hypothetical protein